MLRKLVARLNLVLLLIGTQVALAAPTQNEIIYTDMRGSQTLGLITTGTPYIVNARAEPATYGLVIAGGWGDNLANVSTKLPVLAGRANAASPSWTENYMVPMSMDLSGNLRTVCTNCGNGSGGTSSTDESSFTRASGSFNPVGGYYPSSVTAVSLTAGHVGIALANQYGILLSDPYNSSGSELFTSTTPGQVSLANTASNASTSPIYATPLQNGTNATLKTATGSITSSTNTQIVAAVTSKKIKVLAYSVAVAGSATGTNFDFTDGSGGTNIWNLALLGTTTQGQSAQLAVPYPSFLFSTSAGNALYIATPNNATIYYSVTYWTDDSN